MWCIKRTSAIDFYGQGCVWMNKDRSGTNAIRAERLVSDENDLRAVIKTFRSLFPGHTYKLVRLVTKREKLKRSIESQERAASEKAATVPRAFRWSLGWYEGYARALRDVASQL